MQVGLGPGHIALDQDPASPQKGVQQPTPLSKFTSAAHVYCGQTTGWVKMPFGTEVGLKPGHIVRWGLQLPPKGAQPRFIFGPCMLWPNGWMDQNVSW